MRADGSQEGGVIEMGRGPRIGVADGVEQRAELNADLLVHKVAGIHTLC